jgi:3-oxoadipate CoA-transferase alpha subunit
MIDKRVRSLPEAISRIRDNSVVLVAGFGDIGTPFGLLRALATSGVKGLTIVSNNAGTGERGLALLYKHACVSRLLSSFPSQRNAHHYEAACARGEVEVELVPQGTLAERLRAGGAGLAGFFTPTAYGTELAEGKETRVIDGRGYVFEKALVGDVALIRADLGDAHGNLRYRLASRNFNPIMAMAARNTIAEVRQIASVGDIGPDDVHTPGVYVDAVVESTE